MSIWECVDSPAKGFFLLLVATTMAGPELGPDFCVGVDGCWDGIEETPTVTGGEQLEDDLWEP